MTLKDKVVVITGGTRGIGHALAKTMKREGAHVVICARNSEEVRGISEELDIMGVVTDMTKEQDVQSLADQVVAKMGSIDMWINNAGVWMSHGAVENFDMQKVRSLFDVNFFGTVYGVRSALRCMKKQGDGAIVNIISASGLV